MKLKIIVVKSISYCIQKYKAHHLSFTFPVLTLDQFCFVVSEECAHGEVGISQTHSLTLMKHCRQSLCQGQNN